ncbi:MAG TPA: peptidoglycan-associated lipoprotein Pal [Methylomirabilota bacterium]|nr:peptidoglycan-associated lipoprotein Pal [Methylomirabilota bacterium]
MLTRGSALVVTLLLVAAVVGSGCAKRPATTQAAAPAPTGTASSTTATPGGGAGASQMQSGGGSAGGGTQSAPGGPVTPAPSSTARPAVQDFAAVPELQDIFFDFDKYDIRPNETKTLDANAAWLKSNPNHLVLIEGHCDERGTNEYNLALGERRAKSTMNYLVSQGVQANRITIISYGEERPVCTEKTEACWAKNRRSHFLVKPR